MGYKIGFIGIKARAADLPEGWFQTLFPFAQPLDEIPEDPYPLSLPDDRIVQLAHPHFQLIFNLPLATQLVFGVAEQGKFENNFAKVFKEVDLLVFFYHSNTETFGYMRFHNDQLLSLDTNLSHLPNPQLSKLPKLSFENGNKFDQLESLAKDFLRQDLQLLIDALPPAKMWAC